MSRGSRCSLESCAFVQIPNIKLSKTLCLSVLTSQRHACVVRGWREVPSFLFHSEPPFTRRASTGSFGLCFFPNTLLPEHLLVSFAICRSPKLSHGHVSKYRSVSSLDLCV